MRIISNARLVALDFGQSAATITPKVTSKVRHHTMLLQTRVKAKASGRPGPNAPTGDYRRSIDRRMHVDANMAAGFVGTNKPQGRRLEMGFTGTDRAGRTFNQPPFPHFGPALDDIQPDFVKALGDAVGESL